MSKPLFSPATDEFIQSHYKGVGPSAMAQMVNQEFKTSYTPNQLKAYYTRNHLNSGLTGHFPKGHIPPNKGKRGCCSAGSEKGWFQPGSLPSNTAPVGTVIKRQDGYFWKKVSDDRIPARKNWRQVHILKWEEAHGPVPPKHVVIFKDGDRENTALENLMCISMSDNAVLNKFGLRPSNPEYIETAVMIAKIKGAASRRCKKGKTDE